MPLEGRVRISLTSGEFEVEGSRAFIKEYEGTISKMLRRLEEEAPSARTDNHAADGGRHKTSDGAMRDFGEIFHGVPKHATGPDQMLVSGWFVQKASPEASFTTGDANKLLIGQGIKLSNAAQAMRGNLAAKRVFKVSGNRWRISKQGDDHLKTLVTNS